MTMIDNQTQKIIEHAYGDLIESFLRRFWYDHEQDSQTVKAARQHLGSIIFEVTTNRPLDNRGK